MPAVPPAGAAHGEGGAEPRRPPRFDRASYLAFMALGVLLFAGGVYIGLGVSGAIPSAARGLPYAVYLPFLLTVPGGALLMWAYEGWYQHPEGPGGRHRRLEALKDMPSYEVFSPPSGGRKRG